MTFHSSTGTRLGVSASRPTTYDNSESTGYPSISFAEVGEVIEISPIGKNYATKTRHPIGRDTPIKMKTTYDHDDVSIVCAIDGGDAGQEIINAALNSKNSYSFHVLGSDDISRAFTGKIVAVKEGPWVGEDVVTVSISIAVDAESGAKYTGCELYSCSLVGDLSLLTDTPVVSTQGDVRYSPDGLYLATIGGVLRRSDWGNVGLTLPANVANFAWSPDSTVLYITTTSSPFFYAYLTATWTQIVGTPVLSAAFSFGADVSKDGRYICITSGSAPHYLIIDKTDWSTSTPVATSSTRGRPKFSPDGSKLILTGGISSLILNTADWSLSATVSTSQSYCAAWTPEMDYLAIGHAGVSQGYWALFTYPELTEITEKTHATSTVFDCDINPCGNLLTLVGSSGVPYVDIISTSNWQKLTAPDVTGGSTSCHFDPNGEELVVNRGTGTSRIARYNVATTKICERQI